MFHYLFYYFDGGGSPCCQRTGFELSVFHRFVDHLASMAWCYARHFLLADWLCVDDCGYFFFMIIL